uniref:Uncharacterized protein n=1 Tax=Rangifer tarandus platyrhynchus TaxID=3082113 RepID=A0ACB0ETQ6_RANTA|nr:unnamed protein product [Rangifer tarandus platyrhynchus]
MSLTPRWSHERSTSLPSLPAAASSQSEVLITRETAAGAEDGTSRAHGGLGAVICMGPQERVVRLPRRVPPVPCEQSPLIQSPPHLPDCFRPKARQLQAEGQLCPGSGEHRAAGTGILSQAGGRSAGALDALIGSSGGKLGLCSEPKPGLALIFPCPPPGTPTSGGVHPSDTAARLLAPDLCACAPDHPRLRRVGLLFPASGRPHTEACPPAHAILNRASRFPSVSLGLFLPSAAAILCHARFPCVPPTSALERRLL